MVIHTPGEDKEALDKILYREVTSQIPVHAVRSTYTRMLEHCHEEGSGYQNKWRCSRTGARVKVLMIRQTVMDGPALHGVFPVCHLYCGACDQAPQVKALDLIQMSELQTISM